jgi:fructose-bisphosphate aldolase class II
VLVSTAKLARDAQDRGYAVPAVNVFDDLSMRSVVAAAVSKASPLIIQISVKTVRSLGTDFVTSTFRNAIRDCGVPVALHLDHCPDRAVIDEVLAAGWSSVLFDASDRDLAQAEAETTEVVRAAHALGIDVESEIENIIGVEDGVGSDTALHSYSVEQLAEVAERTGSDLLAPQLGTAHGEYHDQPQLLPERARALVELSGRPVVLHGGTGLDEAEFRSFIDAGVSKINISTAVKTAYMKAAATHLDHARSRNKWDPPSLFADIGAAVQADIEALIDQFGAAGRAQDS